MSSKRSQGKNRSSSKTVMLGIAATLMVLLGVLMGASPALASTASAGQSGGNGLATYVNRAATYIPESYAVGDIQEQPCTSGRATWVHIEFLSQGTLCYGFTGTWYFSGGYIPIHFCSGNNSGTFKYSDINGNEHSFNFGPGANISFLHTDDAVSLTITGYSGNDTC